MDEELIVVLTVTRQEIFTVTKLSYDSPKDVSDKIKRHIKEEQIGADSFSDESQQINIYNKNWQDITHEIQ